MRAPSTTQISSTPALVNDTTSLSPKESTGTQHSKSGDSVIDMNEPDEPPKKKTMLFPWNSCKNTVNSDSGPPAVLSSLNPNGFPQGSLQFPSPLGPPRIPCTQKMPDFPSSNPLCSPFSKGHTVFYPSTQGNPTPTPLPGNMDAQSALAALSVAYSSLIKNSVGPNPAARTSISNFRGSDDTLAPGEKTLSSLLPPFTPLTTMGFPQNLAAQNQALFAPSNIAKPLISSKSNLTNFSQENLSLLMSSLLSENLECWQQFQQAAYANNLDPSLLALYNSAGCALELSGTSRRKNATRETTSMLKAWLNDHRKNPYPTKGEKIMLAIVTKMSLTQVSTWFANARRRLKKENKATWNMRTNCTSDGIGQGDDSNEDEDDDDVDVDPDEVGEQGNNSDDNNNNRRDLDNMNKLNKVTHQLLAAQSHGSQISGEPFRSAFNNCRFPPPSLLNSGGRNTSFSLGPTLPTTPRLSPSDSLSSHHHKECETKHIPGTSLSPSYEHRAVNNELDRTGQKRKIWSLVDMAHDHLSSETSAYPDRNGRTRIIPTMPSHMTAVNTPTSSDRLSSAFPSIVKNPFTTDGKNRGFNALSSPVQIKESNQMINGPPERIPAGLNLTKLLGSSTIPSGLEDWKDMNGNLLSSNSSLSLGDPKNDSFLSPSMLAAFYLYQQQRQDQHQHHQQQQQQQQQQHQQQQQNQPQQVQNQELLQWAYLCQRTKQAKGLSGRDDIPHPIKGTVDPLLQFGAQWASSASRFCEQITNCRSNSS
ncbi:unnamed protein product [Calicophoron daubneyi]|uniref:Homeobox domain-containing protein n=1 Tax=Calicophoron daubneyi TaxID=300641 RepID=A0AAV2TNN3_CALDB